jgi:hypothetical protein
MSSSPGTTRPVTVNSGSPGPTFWVFAVTGLAAMTAAWIWFGMAFEEEMSDQPKAVSAGTTMAGFGASVGIPPLVLAHVIGVIILGMTAFPRSRRAGRGWVWALASVAVASIIGLLVAEWFFGGRLFLMGVDGDMGFVP